MAPRKMKTQDKAPAPVADRSWKRLAEVEKRLANKEKEVSRLRNVTNRLEQRRARTNKTSRRATAAQIRGTAPAVGSAASTLVPAVAQYLDPLNHPPVRLPDTVSAQTVGTALAALSSSVTLTWSASDSSTTANWSTLPSGDTILPNRNTRSIFKLRDPVVALIATEMGPDSLAATPSVYNIFIAPTLSADTDSYGPQVAKITPTLTPLPLWGMIALTGPTRYPDFTPAGFANPSSRVIWIDASPAQPAVVTLTLNNPSSVHMNLLSQLWTNPTLPTCANEKQFGPGTFTYSINLEAAGYWSFALSIDSLPVSGAVLATIVAFSVSVSTTTWCSHYVHDSMLDAGSLFQDVRVLGDAVLTSNTTSEFFKNGMLYARQLQANQPWFVAAQTEDEYTSLNVREMYQGRLAKGLYAMVKPQGDTDAAPFALRKTNIQSGGPLNIPLLGFYPFDVPGVVSALFVPSQPATADQATSMNIHFMRSIEYTTDSQLVIVDVTSVHRSQFPDILDAISACPQFFENPLHLSEIRELISKIAAWAWANRSKISSIASVLGSLAVA